MDKLRQDMKRRQFEKVYLLYGAESYLVQLYKKQLKEALVGDDAMNFNCYTGKGISLQEVSDTVATMPFFADRRLVLIEDSGLFKSSNEEWESLIRSIPDGSYLIFAEQEADKRTRLYKAVKECGYCCEMARQTQAQLTQWCLRGFGQSGLKITGPALESFLNKTGDDMENIRCEMEKLICYCMGKEGITEDDVEAVCTERINNRIFDMTQAAAQGNTALALELYDDLLALKEPGMRILFLLARQMNQLLCIKEMEAARQSRDQMAASLKVRPFVVGKLLSQARAFTTKQLKACVENCVSMEAAVKRGNMNERIAVEMVLLAVSKRTLLPAK